MQLVKNLYDPQAGRTLSKKIEEAYLAYQYEKKYTKDEILTQYLNGVFYGQNAVGVQAAVADLLRHRRLGTSPFPRPRCSRACPRRRAPTTRSRNPEQARERRNVVLDQMADQGYITREVADTAMRSGLALKRGKAYKRKREEYFFEYVRQAADRPLRRGARAAGRLQGLHDHRLEAADRGAPGDQEEPLLRRRPGGGRRDGRLEEGLHPRHGLEPDLQPGQPVQPGHLGRAPARLDVQDLRAHPGDHGRDQPVHDHLREQAPELRGPRLRAHRRQDVLGHATAGRSRSPRPRSAPTTRSSSSSPWTWGRRT